MKKTIALLLIALLFITSLAGCGGSEATDASSTDSGSKLPTASDTSSKPTKLVEIENPFTEKEKGYINHSLVAEYTVKAEDGYECTGENLIFLPKNSVISCEKEFALHTYVKMDGGVGLNTNLMRAIGVEVDGYNSSFKAGSYTLPSDCYLRISVKGSLSDLKISVPDGSEASIFIGNADAVAVAPEVEKLGNFFQTTGKSVNYLFISDLHNGSYVNDLNDDGKRDYDPLDEIANRLETRRAKVANAVAMANTSPYIDFLVIGGDIINGYETTESHTYKEAKKKNPKLTVSEHCIDLIQEILAPLKDCKKPVFVLAGNHDDNSGHRLWQENHPEGPSLYPEYLVSDLAWQKEVFSEFVNVKVVQDTEYTHSGKKLSKYYYYDLEKYGKTTRIICLDYNDDRFPFDSKGVVTEATSMGGYSNGQLKWLATTALNGDFDDCIILSHAGFTDDSEQDSSNSPLRLILTAYQEETLYRKSSLGVNMNYAGRKSGDILSYHHGHEHEDFNKFSFDTDYWTLASNSMALEAVASSKDSVYRYYMDNTGTIKELTRSGTIK